MENHSFHLQVQALRLALALGLQYSLPSGSEILHLYPHASLAKGHQTCFGAYGFDIGAGQIVLLADEFVQVNVLAERHLAGV